jgi:hypothetical protein
MHFIVSVTMMTLASVKTIPTLVQTMKTAILVTKFAKNSHVFLMTKTLQDAQKIQIVIRQTTAL